MASRFFHSAACRAAAGIIFSLCIAAPFCVRGSVLVLANGDRLTGKVIVRSGGKIQFHSDILGDITVGESTATVVESPPAAASGAASSASAAKSPHAAAKPASVPGHPVSPWATKLEFGYDNSVLAVRAVNAVVRVDAEHKLGPDNFLLKGQYIYGASAGQTSADQIESSLQWRHDLSPRIFSQTQTSYDSDQIRLVHDAVDQTVDMGYHLLQKPQHTLDFGGGINGEYLNATGIEPGFGYLGNAFQNYRYKITHQITFIEDATAEYSPERRARLSIVPDSMAPVGSSTQDYAYKFHSTLESKLNPHLSLNLHFEYEFDNAVLDPTTRVEQRVTTTLGYAF